MTQTYCDRCGKLLPPSVLQASGQVHFRRMIWTEQEPVEHAVDVDLCPPCYTYILAKCKPGPNLSPGVLANAQQDTVHAPSTRSRAGKSTKAKRRNDGPDGNPKG